MRISSLFSGGLISNYNCSAACRHCLYRSSPRRDASYIDPEFARSLLHRARSLGCRGMHIGGGEPFLRFRELLDTVGVFRDAGMRLDYLETNASWFTDKASAIEKLSRLAAAGCDTVMVSICPFHIEFIPLYKPEGVIEACKSAGMNFFIWQEQYYRELSSLDHGRTHTREELEAAFGPDYLLRAAGRFGLTMNGRALESFKPFFRHSSAEEICAANPGACTEAGETSHFHMDLYGNYIPPGCVGFTIDHEDLGSELDPERYPLFLTMLSEGISALYEQARRDSGFIPDPEGYISKCDLCQEIRTWMSKMTFSGELGPAEFYSPAR